MQVLKAHPGLYSRSISKNSINGALKEHLSWLLFCNSDKRSKTFLNLQRWDCEPKGAGSKETVAMAHEANAKQRCTTNGGALQE